MQETQIWSLGQEDPLEKQMETHSSVIAWEIPWTPVHGVAKNQTQLINSRTKNPILYVILYPETLLYLFISSNSFWWNILGFLYVI